MSQTTQLTVADKARKELAVAVQQNSDLLEIVPLNKRDEFRENIIEFATGNEYLMQTIAPREIIRFAARITKAGLSIDPSRKEVYIVPFNTKVNGNKTMLPQAIIPLNGVQEIAFAKGFFFRLWAVYKIGNEYASEKDMERRLQAQLKTSDPKWVDEHFIGFDVELADMKKELLTQTKFVEVAYLRDVTKTMQDNRFQIQAWRHKAARRALSDFFIPRNRSIDVFEKVEALNDEELGKADAIKEEVVLFDNNIKEQLRPLGLSFSIANRVATLSGPVYENAKLLKGMGFVLRDGKYTMEVSPEMEDEPIDVEPEQQSPSTTSNSEEEIANPAKELATFLAGAGYTKDEISDFVRNHLGLTPEDKDGILAELADKESLIGKAKEYFVKKQSTLPFEDDEEEIDF